MPYAELELVAVKLTMPLNFFKPIHNEYLASRFSLAPMSAFTTQRTLNPRKLSNRGRIENTGYGRDNVMLCRCSAWRDHFFVDYAVELHSQRDEKLRVARWAIEDDPIVDADLTLFLVEQQLAPEHQQRQLQPDHASTTARFRDSLQRKAKESPTLSLSVSLFVVRAWCCSQKTVAIRKTSP